LYEWKMNRVIKKHSFSEKIKSEIISKLADMDENSDSLISLFKKSHQQYLDQVDYNLHINVERDLNHSAVIASVILISVLETAAVEVDAQEPALA